jgi:nucleoside-diphosphate-sugar epimerase
MQGAPRPTVLVTGSTGLIGAAVARSLAPEVRVIGLDRTAPRTVGALEEFVPCDLALDASVTDAFEHIHRRYGRRIASVLHLGPEGTDRLVGHLAPDDIEQLVLLGSAVGPTPAEQIVSEQWGGRYVVLRAGEPYDDACRSPRLARRIARAIESRRESSTVPADTSPALAFVHVEDLVDAFDLVVRARDRLGRGSVFIVAEAETLRPTDLDREIARAVHGDREAPPEEPTLDTTKARVELGWEARRRLRATLPTMIERLRRDPLAWYQENGLEPPATVETLRSSRGAGGAS